MCVYGGWKTNVPEAREDSRDKRPAYVSSLCTPQGRSPRVYKAFKYGYTRSTLPGTVYLETPAYVSPIWNCRARLPGRRPVVTWSYIHTIVPLITTTGVE